MATESIALCLDLPPLLGCYNNERSGQQDREPLRAKEVRCRSALSFFARVFAPGFIYLVRSNRIGGILCAALRHAFALL